MNDSFMRTQTYSCDKLLFETLGFKEFDIPNGERYYIGEYKYDDGSYIKVWVIGYPAQFFEAEIYCSETDKKYNVNTGSGSLESVWESFDWIATDMLIVSEIK